MSLFQNLGVALSFLVISVAAYFYCYGENVFTLNPLIDTQLPQGFVIEKFDQIKPGMTEQQVLQLVPRPQSTYQSVWQYGNDGASPFGDFAWISFEVEFDQTGRVVKASRRTFYD